MAMENVPSWLALLVGLATVITSIATLLVAISSHRTAKVATVAP